MIGADVLARGGGEGEVQGGLLYIVCGCGGVESAAGEGDEGYGWDSRFLWMDGWIDRQFD